MIRATRNLMVSITCLFLAACAVSPQPVKVAVPVDAPGFLPKAELIGATVLPPPPAQGSAAHAADDEAFRASQRLRDTPRWKWAVTDADVKFPGAAERLSCAAGLPLDPGSMPQTYLLLRRSFMDAGIAAHQAQAAFDRQRPFVKAAAPICTPDWTDYFRKDTSYPSANASIGWAWALILTELVPDRAEFLARRGLAYGDSRVVCGVDWKTDVDAGRLLGAAVVAQLHANREFRSQLELARTEVAAARGSGAKPTANCGAEAEALGR